MPTSCGTQGILSGVQTFNAWPGGIAKATARYVRFRSQAGTATIIQFAEAGVSIHFRNLRVKRIRSVLDDNFSHKSSSTQSYLTWDGGRSCGSKERIDMMLLGD